MTPEQASGKPVDRRADIWAFGVVLFEVLTGRSLYMTATRRRRWRTSSNGSPTLVRCRRRPRRDPRPHRALPHEGSPQAPAGDRRSPHRDRTCDRAAGFAGARRRACIGIPASGVATRLAAGSAVPRWRARDSRGGVQAAGSAGVVAPAAHRRTRRERHAGRRSRRCRGPVRGRRHDGVHRATGQRRAGRIYVRSLSQLQARALTGTEDAHGPFFSPDGERIGFFAGGKLKTASASGGDVKTVCDAANGRGGAWAPDGTIIFSPDYGEGIGLGRVSSAGGTPEPLESLPIARPRNAGRKSCPAARRSSTQAAPAPATSAMRRWSCSRCRAAHGRSFSAARFTVATSPAAICCTSVTAR